MLRTFLYMSVQCTVVYIYCSFSCNVDKNKVSSFELWILSLFRTWKIESMILLEREFQDFSFAPKLKSALFQIPNYAKCFPQYLHATYCASLQSTAWWLSLMKKINALLIFGGIQAYSYYKMRSLFLYSHTRQQKLLGRIPWNFAWMTFRC